MFTEDTRVMQQRVVAAPRHRRRVTSSEVFDRIYRITDVVEFIMSGSQLPQTLQGGGGGGGKGAAPFTKVGLQFPDTQLHDTVRLVHRLKEALAAAGHPGDARLFILADNTFGACCPDEITAQHYSADAIVHFGTACMSRTVRLPVLYVHDHIDASTASMTAAAVAQRLRRVVFDSVASAIPAPSSSSSGDAGPAVQIVVLMPIGLSTTIGSAVADACRADVGPNLVARGVEMVFASPVVLSPSTQGSLESAAATWQVNGLSFPRVATSTPTAQPLRQLLVFVGAVTSSDPLLAQLSLIAEYNEAQWQRAVGLEEGCCGRERLEAVQALQSLFFVSVDGSGADDSGCRDTSDASMDVALQEAADGTLARCTRLARSRLRQRMFNVETLKSASAVGIIVASLAIHRYREVAEAVRAALISANKRAYIIYVGHPNEFKIANFADSMDVFCIIACPNSRLAHFPSKDDNLMKPLVTPFEVFLALGHADYSCPEAFTTHFAPVLRIAEQALAGDRCSSNNEDDRTASAALVKGRPMNVAVLGGSAGALQRLHEREYVGLEMRVGETPVQEALADGKSGIARGYAAEREAQQ